jgi:hypothetical protein
VDTITLLLVFLICSKSRGSHVERGRMRCRSFLFRSQTNKRKRSRNSPVLAQPLWRRLVNLPATWEEFSGPRPKMQWGSLSEIPALRSGSNRVEI